MYQPSWIGLLHLWHPWRLKQFEVKAVWLISLLCFIPISQTYANFLTSWTPNIFSISFGNGLVIGPTTVYILLHFAFL